MGYVQALANKASGGTPDGASPAGEKILSPVEDVCSAVVDICVGRFKRGELITRSEVAVALNHYGVTDIKYQMIVVGDLGRRDVEVHRR